MAQKRPKTIAVGRRLKLRAIRGPHKDGSGRWYWRAERYDPATRKRATAWTGWASVADAERIGAQFVVEAREPVAPADLAGLHTVRDLLEAWVGHVSTVGGRRGPLKPSSVRIYTYAARHLVAVLGPIRVDRLRRHHVEDYRDRRLRAGAAPWTVSNEVKALRIAFGWLADRSPVALPPFPKVAVKTRCVGNRYTPTRHDVRRVAVELDGWARVALVLLYATGARPGEVRDLVWDRVDLEARTLLLDGKTGSREVPVSSEVCGILAAWRDSSDSRPGATLLGVTVSSFNSYFGPRLLRRACERAGVPVFTPYGLRRAAVDAMARAGVDVATAAAVTGHSPEVMLRHYRQVSGDDKRRAVEAAQLGSLQGGKVLAFPVP